MRRFLLDTHIVIWLSDQTELVPSEVADLLRDDNSNLLVSAVTVWEMSIKHRAGRLKSKRPIEDWASKAFDDIGIERLDVTPAHGVLAGQLPLIHRDPFDRLLIAQAILEGCTLVTRDSEILRYSVPVLRA